jgi:hypothetical protein
VFIDQNAFEGDIDPIFCPLEEGQVFEADCFERVQCSCCTACCDGPENQCLARTEAPSNGPDISVSSPPTQRPTVSRIPTPTPTTLPPVPTVAPANLVPTSPPVTLTPSESLGLRYEAVREVLLQVSTEEALDDQSSPQHATMVWIVENDQAQISPTDEGVLLMRYIVSLVYFSMDGDRWWNSFGFLGPSNICDWNDSGNSGCYCLTDGTRDILIEIALCKLTNVTSESKQSILLPHKLSPYLYSREQSAWQIAR